MTDAGSGVIWKSILRDVQIPLRLGIHDHEQHAAQPVNVSVELERSETAAFAAAALHEVIDYDPVRNFVLGWQARQQVPLIEGLLVELLDFCFKDPKVDAVRASILKTTVFAETREAGVEVYCTRESWKKARV